MIKINIYINFLNYTLYIIFLFFYYLLFMQKGKIPKILYCREKYSNRYLVRGFRHEQSRECVVALQSREGFG